MATVDPLPCPFCGGTKITFSGGERSAAFGCGTCLAEGPYIRDDDWDKALEAWNARAASPGEGNK